MRKALLISFFLFLLSFDANAKCCKKDTPCPSKCRAFVHNRYGCPIDKTCIICKVVQHHYLVKGWECQRTCCCYEETYCEFGCRKRTKMRCKPVKNWVLRSKKKVCTSFVYYPCEKKFPSSYCELEPYRGCIDLPKCCP